MKDPERYAPGTFGCHEALDRASLLMELVHELDDHGAIQRVPEWAALAMRAGDALFALYQSIGEVHLAVTEPTADPMTEPSAPTLSTEQ